MPKSAVSTLLLVAACGGTAVVPVPSAGSESTGSGTEATETAVPSPPVEQAPVAAEPQVAPVAVAPRNLPPARPCRVDVVQRTDERECVALERVQPESVPLGGCAGAGATQRFTYDAEGRILTAPGATYTHGAAGAATRVEGRRRSRLRFDAAQRLVRLDRTEFQYDELGRLVREVDGRHTVSFVYAEDDTYAVEHDYPDTDEFCMADRVEVRRDAVGRVVFDRYSGCQINEPLRSLHYTYDDADRIATVGVDVGSDGTVDVELTLSYACE